MKFKIGLLIILLLGVGIGIWYLRTSPSTYSVTRLDIIQDNNPPSYNGVKSGKAFRIAMSVRYEGAPKHLNFTSTCQNANLTLKDQNGRPVPKLDGRMCGQATTTRDLKAGDTIEAEELFDLDGFPSANYVLSFSYQDVLSFEKDVTIP